MCCATMYMKEYFLSKFVFHLLCHVLLLTKTYSLGIAISIQMKPQASLDDVSAPHKRRLKKKRKKEKTETLVFSIAKSNFCSLSRWGTVIPLPEVFGYETVNFSFEFDVNFVGFQTIFQKIFSQRYFCNVVSLIFATSFYHWANIHRNKSYDSCIRFKL